MDKTMELLDKDHVRNKFSVVSDVLVDRLGRANTQRRANFRYLQQRHQKFLQGLDDDGSEDGGDAKGKMSGTISSDDAISVAASGTSYAASLFTESAQHFPAMPRPTTKGGYFECPTRLYRIKIDSLDSWRKHIFVDLQQYVCLFPECSHGNRLIPSRHEWLAYELQLHAKSIDMCTLCDKKVAFADGEKHIRHLEDVSLFVLPSSLFDDEANEEKAGIRSTEPDSASDLKEQDPTVLARDGENLRERLVLKCAQCRKDQNKCYPGGSKCLGCESRGFECGPSHLNVWLMLCSNWKPR